MIKWEEPGNSRIEIPARISKTRRTRIVPIPEGVSHILVRRYKRGNGSPFVFPARVDPTRPQLTYHAAWRTANKHAGISAKAVPYDCRRAFITQAAASNQPVTYLGKCLDTSPKMISDVYAKDQMDTMRDIMNRKKRDKE
jgi:hypothetical protein